ncbi:extensin-like [Penaeus monodon]|uniref:extensin-like n=1 Tax=Penaeus monodon TaxID=6687 RepID=UPI0018A704E0|nr:extensin-like [Penaeus monodon]
MFSKQQLSITPTSHTPPVIRPPTKLTFHISPSHNTPYLHSKHFHTLHTYTYDRQSFPPKTLPSLLAWASQLPRALADSPTFNSAEPSTCPSPGAPSQQIPVHTDSPASPKSTKAPPAVRPKTNTPKKTNVEAST